MDKNVEYKVRIKDLPKDERPRERLIKYGPKHLSTAELLAIIMRVGTRQKKAVDYIKKKGKITSREYRKITGIGKVYAVRELNELVQRKILIKKGKGRGIHYLLSERLVND